jgi:hypothetical protein
MSRRSHLWKVPDDRKYIISPLSVAIWLVESEDNAWVSSRLAGDSAKMLLAHFRYELPIHVVADRFHRQQPDVKRDLIETLDVLRAGAMARPKVSEAVEHDDFDAVGHDDFEAIGHDAKRWRERHGSTSTLDWVMPCPSCGSSLILWAPYGRPRRYCSAACRRRAHRLLADGKELVMLPIDEPPQWTPLSREVMSHDPSIVRDVDVNTARVLPGGWWRRV